LERGYCQMIGGEPEIVRHLDPIFRTLAPGVAAAPRTVGAAGEPSQAEHGYLYCGPNGGGHFVKMVHNGIEYGIMAAYSEGLNIIKNANVGRHSHAVDAETTPLRNPEFYRYEFDIAQIAEVWRRHRFMVTRSHRRGSAQQSSVVEFRGTCLGFRRGTLDVAGGDR
jgi:6-phosphogluconate dehydrogenase